MLVIAYNKFSFRSSHPEVFGKFLKIHSKTPVSKSLFDKMQVAAIKFIKQLLRHKYLPVNFAIFLKTIFYLKHVWLTTSLCYSFQFNTNISEVWQRWWEIKWASIFVWEEIHKIHCCISDIINPFLPGVPFWSPWKKLENQRFSNVFRGVKRENWEGKG